MLTAGDEVQRQTIEAYLDEAGRAPDTCARLHIHRTTLYYRLEHMPSAVREALADGLQRSTLHLALKTARLWEARPELASAWAAVGLISSARAAILIAGPDWRAATTVMSVREHRDSARSRHGRRAPRRPRPTVASPRSVRRRA
jgi:hypothetical protein